MKYKDRQDLLYATDAPIGLDEIRAAVEEAHERLLALLESRIPSNIYNDIALELSDIVSTFDAAEDRLGDPKRVVIAESRLKIDIAHYSSLLEMTYQNLRTHGDVLLKVPGFWMRLRKAKDIIRGASLIYQKLAANRLGRCDFRKDLI